MTTTRSEAPKVDLRRADERFATKLPWLDSQGGLVPVASGMAGEGSR